MNRLHSTRAQRLAKHPAATRAVIHIGSETDKMLRFWAAMYPAYSVRRAAFYEMARRERMEAA